MRKSLSQRITGVIPGKKKWVCKFLISSGLAKAERRLLPGNRLVIFNYHRLRSDKAGESADFDEGVFGPTAEMFRTHLKWLTENAEILSEDDLLCAYRHSMPLPPRSVVITFDDGYRDCYTEALPAIREFGAPAMFFIPTEAIEDRKVGWWDLIAYGVKNTKRPEITVRGEHFAVADRGALTRVFIDRMTTLNSRETDSLVSDLYQACEVEPPSRQRCSDELMSWDEIREAASTGVDIGSHTHSHRVLSTLNPTAQKLELSLSKKILEERLGAPVHSIAYPVGGYEHFNVETMELAKSCGYQLGFSFLTGHNSQIRNTFDLKRIASPNDLSQMEATLGFPAILARRSCANRYPARGIA